MNAKSNPKQDALMAALRNTSTPVAAVAQPIESPEPTPATEELPPEPVTRKTAQPTASASAAPKKKGGKNVHFFMHDDDKRWIRELATWISGQGERPNDSLVVRAALRAVKTDAAFLKAYRAARELDGRLKRQ